MNADGRRSGNLLAAAPAVTQRIDIDGALKLLRTPCGAILVDPIRDARRLDPSYRSALPVLCAALRDKSEDVRLFAINSIRAIGAPWDPGVLKEIAAAASERQLQHDAVKILRDAQSELSIPGLRHVVRDWKASISDRLSALRGLREITGSCRRAFATVTRSADSRGGVGAGS